MSKEKINNSQKNDYDKQNALGKSGVKILYLIVILMIVISLWLGLSTNILDFFGKGIILITLLPIIFLIICIKIIFTEIKKSQNLSDKNYKTEKSQSKKEKILPFTQQESKKSDPLLSVYETHEKPVITEKPKKKCPKCGAGNGLDAKFCMICNAKFKTNKRKGQ